MAKKNAPKPTREDQPKNALQPTGLPEGTRPEDFKPIEAPYTYASVVAVSGTGGEFIMTFSRAKPLVVAQTGQAASIAITEPVALIVVSPQTMKDMALVLSDQVAAHEKKFGEIHTPFTQNREAEKTKH